MTPSAYMHVYGSNFGESRIGQRVNGLVSWGAERVAYARLMTSIAKALIAAIGAAGITANAVASAHGWSGVDWTPVATAWATAVAVFAYPNVTGAPKALPTP